MKKVKIGNIAKIFNGYAFKSTEYSDDGFQVIRITNVQNGYISNDNQKYIKLNNKSLERFILNDGDILISLTGNVGRVGRIGKENLPAVLNQRVGKVIIQSKEVFPDYLFHILKSGVVESELIGKAKGIAQKNIGSLDIENIEIPLPPLEDQKRIVKILDEADALRQKRKKAIGLLDDYLKSVFLEMFGPNARNYDKWEEVKLENLAENKKGSMRTGPFGSDLKHSEFVDQGISVIGIDNAVKNKFEWGQRRFITKEKYQKLKRYTLYPDDVIITIMATIGKSAVIPKDIPLSINTKHLASITLNKQKANSYFISYSIHSNPYIKRQIEGKNIGAIMPGLNLSIIKDLKIKKPPIDLQNKFEVLYHQTEALKQSMFIQAAELEFQFQALMQEAFKGTLD